jgi:hypothetical protein
MTDNTDNRIFILNTLETKKCNKPKEPFPQPKPINGFSEKENSYD